MSLRETSPYLEFLWKAFSTRKNFVRLHPFDHVHESVYERTAPTPKNHPFPRNSAIKHVRCEVGLDE